MRLSCVTLLVEDLPAVTARAAKIRHDEHLGASSRRRSSPCAAGA